MQVKYTMDKTYWPSGIWKNEPDVAVWICEITNYPCVAARNKFGVWCGFVGLEFNHPMYLMSSKEESLKFVEIHGGPISYDGYIDDFDILFDPPTRKWWFGFDTMHEMDVCPVFHDEINEIKKMKKLKSLKPEFIPTYKDFNYIQEEITLLAAQLEYFDDRFYKNVEEMLKEII